MLINGTTIDATPTVGRLHELDLDPAGQGAFSDGRQGAIWFGVEFDAGVTGAATFFEIILPLVVGRLTALSVVGYGAAAPVHTITLTDQQGRDWSFNITGDTDNCIAAPIPDLVGQLTFKATATNMAGERVRYALYFTDNVTILNGTVPTGTGFRHVTAGAEDAAARTIATADVDADAITYEKMQNVSATDKVLGRSTAGAGDVEEIACTAAGRALIDDASAAAQRTTLALDAHARTQASPADPTGTSSAAGVMMGLAGSITPVIGSKVVVMITGDVKAGATQTAGMQIRYGTGTAPTNAAALTGTAVGNPVAMIGTIAGQWAMTCHAIISGLTPGTAYWLDISLSASGGVVTATAKNISITAFEIL